MGDRIPVADRTEIEVLHAKPASQWPFTISVVIPAYNEGYGIRQVVDQIRYIIPEAEVLVIDDGSQDNTASQAEEAGAKIIRHPYNIGNGAAVKTGIRNASGEVVLVIDADGQHNPSDIIQILEPLMQGYMMAVGARNIETHASFVRLIGNTALNSFAGYIVGQ